MRIRIAPISSANRNCFILSGTMSTVAFACLIVAALVLVLHDYSFLPNLDLLHGINFAAGSLFATSHIVELPLAVLGGVSAETVHLLQGVALLSSGLSPPLM